MLISDQIEAVKQRIAKACARSGRDPEGVRLIGVSKTVHPERVREAFECGLNIMGESRIQEAREKISMCPCGIEWHMIGHLQSNKVREAVRLFRMIHSVDSVRLLEIIDREASSAGLEVPVCLEINVSGEGSKFGIQPECLDQALIAGKSLVNVAIVGLMTIPPASADPEDARKYFRELRQIRDRARELSGADLPELSMGMSNDFEVAVEEGSTMVRVGSLIFGER